MACASAAVAAIAAAPAAARESILTGTTADGAAVELTVSDFGNATKFRVAGTTIQCERGGELQTGATTFRKFRISDPDSFRAKGRSRARDGGLKLKGRFRAAGTTADGITWTGRYKETTRVFEDRRRIDTCRLRTSWSAG